MRWSARAVEYEWAGQIWRVSTAGIAALSLAVGFVGGVYGIGGGAIIAPFLVARLRLPVHTVAGAALTATLVTSAAGVACFVVLAPLYPELSVVPDWILGGLFGMGGAVGTYLGARLQKHAPARCIKWVLVVLVMLIAVRYLWDAV